jgi:hypothetical protein
MVCGFQASLAPSGTPSTGFERLHHFVERPLRSRSRGRPRRGDVLGAGFQRRFEHLSASPALGRIGDQAHAVEAMADRARRAEIAAVLGESGAHVGAVRLRLSVSASTISATPPGPKPS